MYAYLGFSTEIKIFIHKHIRGTKMCVIMELKSRKDKWYSTKIVDEHTVWDFRIIFNGIREKICLDGKHYYLHFQPQCCQEDTTWMSIPKWPKVSNIKNPCKYDTLTSTYTCVWYLANTNIYQRKRLSLSLSVYSHYIIFNFIIVKTHETATRTELKKK